MLSLWAGGVQQPFEGFASVESKEVIALLLSESNSPVMSTQRSSCKLVRWVLDQALAGISAVKTEPSPGRLVTIMDPP
jgi:hypothetical protein